MVQIELVDRQATKELILAMCGGMLSETDTRALNACTSYASHLWVGYINARPVCAWGLVPPTLLSEQAYLWLYSTDEVEEYKFLFIRRSQLVMEEMRKIYPLIYGVCATNRPKSMRWLKWLGARFGEPGPTHVPFQIGGKNG